MHEVQVPKAPVHLPTAPLTKHIEPEYPIQVPPIVVKPVIVNVPMPTFPLVIIPPVGAVLTA